MLRHVTAIMGFSWVGALGSRMLHWPLGWFTAGSPARWGGDGVQTVGCEISALNVWIGRIDTIPSTYSMIHNMFTKKHILYTHYYIHTCAYAPFYTFFTVLTFAKSILVTIQQHTIVDGLAWYFKINVQWPSDSWCCSKSKANQAEVSNQMADLSKWNGNKHLEPSVK